MSLERLSIVFTLLLVLSGAAAAQTVNGSSNAASYIAAGLPNGGLAQGSVATFFVNGLPIDALAQVSAFPLGETLDGVSVTITSAGVDYPALPIILGPTGGGNAQVSAIIRSNTPLGAATAVVAKNGTSTPPFNVRIVAHAPGIFALNQGGSGPGIFTDPLNGFAVNLVSASYQPGQLADIWGTGLGAVQGDETIPQPGDLRGMYDVHIYVGGQEVEVQYAGRSGADAGLDQYRAVLPLNIVGCYVPVVIVVNGVASNTVTISISEGSGYCSDPYGLSADDISQGLESGGLNVGTISMSRLRLRFSNPLGGFITQTTDTGSATFERYAASQLYSIQSLSGYVTPGACIVFQFEGSDSEDVPSSPSEFDPVQPAQFLNAGAAINIMHGVNGNRALQMDSPGNYSATLGGEGLGAGQPLFLSGGNYSFDNGGGGNDIPSFNAQASFPDPLTWTNRDDVFNILTGPQLLTWTGGQGLAIIFGASINEDQIGAGFFCLAESAAQQFLIPKWAIDALPPSGSTEGVPLGFIALGNAANPVEFTASNLDFGSIEFSSMEMQSASYHVEAPEPGNGGDGGGNGGGGNGGDFAISSTSFSNGGVIPNEYGGSTCGFANVSPQLTWGTAPAGTETIAIFMDDPEAEGFVHWALWDIPASQTGIAEGNPQNLGTTGRNSYGEFGYGGPCPPPGQNHTYRIRVFAVDAVLNLNPTFLTGAQIGSLLNQFGVHLPTLTYTGTFGQ